MDDLQLIHEFYKTIDSELCNFTELMPMIVPDNDEDKALIKLALDMVESFSSELKNATSVSDVLGTIKLEELRENWDDIRTSLRDGYDPEIYSTQTAIMEEFDVEEP